MAEQLDVINLALSHIAQTPITAVQLAALTGNVQVEAALRLWEYAREETLRAYNWGFAKVQQALVITTDYDPAVYAYAYVYPTDCVAIRKVNVQASIDNTISGKYKTVYDKEKSLQRIVTDIEDAYIEYTYDHDTPTLWDSAFVVAFAYRLAAELAKPLNGDDKQAEDKGKLFDIAISEAKRYDSDNKNEPHEGNTKSNYAEARG
ncbi:hypothetical protein D4R71_00325 [bacterium]|nr:MAG: hypothetical protein D4R71_00325 [bacterium]